MNCTRDIRGLRRYMLLGQVVSIMVFLFGLLSLCLFVDPALVGIVGKEQGDYRGVPMWLFIGIAFIPFGLFCAIGFNKWSSRLVWVFRNIIPVPMNLSIEIDNGMDSTDYYAILSGDSGGEKNWRVSLYSPSWQVEKLQNQQVPAKVYFDPKSQRPAVIETTQGLLWARAGRSAIQINAVD
jgi:hypothetical protein